MVPLLVDYLAARVRSTKLSLLMRRSLPPCTDWGTILARLLDLRTEGWAIPSGIVAGFADPTNCAPSAVADAAGAVETAIGVVNSSVFVVILRSQASAVQRNNGKLLSHASIGTLVIRQGSSETSLQKEETHTFQPLRHSTPYLVCCDVPRVHCLVQPCQLCNSTECCC